MKLQLFLYFFVCYWAVANSYFKNCSSYLGCAFSFLNCPSGSETCDIYCSGSGGCRASIIECAEGSDCNIYCSGSSACTDATINCGSAKSCNLLCSGTTGCNLATVSSETTGITNITCTSGRSSCQEIVVDCDGAANCTLNCLGSASSCYSGFLTCPSSPSASCNVNCADYSISNCPSGKTCYPTCYNMQIDCQTSGTCDLNCGGSSSTTKFPPACFSSLLLCNQNTDNCGCTGFCGYSSLGNFYTQIDYSDSDCSFSSMDNDGKALSTFSGNMTGLLYDWGKQCSPCGQYYNGTKVYYMSQWSGVECDYTLGGVIYLRLQSKGLSGTTNISSLPSSLQILNLRDNSLSGTLELNKLTTTIKYLYFTNNEFSGTIEFQGQGNVQYIDLHENKLTGDFNLSQIPSLILYLALSDNQLSGTIDFSVLTSTSTLQVLNLGNNQFSGNLNLTNFNTYLKQLDLSDNDFSSFVDFAKFPSSIELLYLQGNSFYGSSSSFGSFPSNLLEVDFSENYFNASVSSILTAITSLSSIRSLKFSDNEIYGTADLSNLPSTLQTLDMSSNYISSISSWGSSSTKDSSVLTYLDVCYNDINQYWDPTYLPNSLETLFICHNNFSGSIDFTSLPTSITTFNASYNTYLTGTVSFVNLPSSLSTINILQTGVSKPVVFTGMGDSKPYLAMEKQVTCDSSVYCPQNGTCYKSVARWSKYCTGLSSCNLTCHCIPCDETTYSPTSSAPTSYPTKKPTKKPTRRPGDTTAAPTSPPPPTKAPTKKPTYYHYAQVSIYDSSYSTDFKFVPNNQYKLTAKIYNMSNLYWDLNCSTCFEWVCENCKNGPVVLSSLSYDYVSTSVAESYENYPVYATLTLYPETSSTTYCTYSSLIGEYMDYGTYYNITFRAIGYSKYNQDSFEYAKSIELYVVSTPENITCYYALPEDGDVYCYESQVIFQCNTAGIRDSDGEDSFLYGWLLYSDSSSVFVRQMGESDTYTTSCIGPGTSVYSAVVMDVNGMTSCSNVSITAIPDPELTTCPYTHCLNSSGLAAVVYSLLGSNVNSAYNSLSASDAATLAAQIAASSSESIAGQLSNTLLISQIVNKLAASSSVDSLMESFYESLMDLLALYEYKNYNGSALSVSDYTQLFTTVCTLQYFRNASAESTKTAYTYGGYLYDMVQVISQLSLIHTDAGDFITYNDTKYDIMILRATRMNRTSPTFGTSTVSVPTSFLNEFSSDILDSIVASIYSNFYDKSYDSTNEFPSDYLLFDIEVGLEYASSSSSSSGLYHSSLTQQFKSKSNIKQRLKSQNVNNYVSSTTSKCNKILFELDYSNSLFFDSLEAKEQCRFPQCSYYDTSKHRFTTSGCYVYEKTSTSYTCACENVAYFAGSWETWCPDVKASSDFGFLIPTISNIGAHPAGAISVFILLVLLGVSVTFSKPMDDKPLLAIKHATIADFSKKRFAETKIGYERAILMQITWSTLDKATELFKVNFLDDHILFGVWFRKPHSNISTHIRVGLLFMLVITLLCASAMYYGSPRNDNLGEIGACIWISFLCCLPPMGLAILFTYAYPIERIDDKLLQPVKSMHALASAPAPQQNILDNDNAGGVGNLGPGGDDDEDSVLGRNNLMNEVAGMLGTSSNTGMYAGGEEPGREPGGGGRKMKKQKSELQIQKEELRRAELQHRQAKASLKRYELAEKTRQTLLRQKYIFPSYFKQLGWLIMVIWSIICIILLFLFAMKINALYTLTNNYNVLSDCTSPYGVDISLKTQLSYNATEQYLTYFDQSTPYISPTHGDHWRPASLSNIERWLISFATMLLLCLFGWNIAYIYLIQWKKVAFFDPMKIDEGFYFSNDDILWDPNENYHNPDVRRKKSAELNDGDIPTTQPIQMEADGQQTGAITGLVEMMNRRDSVSDDANGQNGPNIHNVFHALVAGDGAGDGDGGMQTGDQLPQGPYMNVGYQYAMALPDLPPQPMVQGTPGNGDMDNDNLNSAILPPQPQVNATPQDPGDQRHAIFHQMVALNEANDHNELIENLIQHQPQQYYQLPPQPEVDNNMTAGYIPPAEEQEQRQGGRLMSFGSQSNNDETPGN